MDKKNRFSNWQYPEIIEGKPTKYNWVVQNLDGLELGFETDIGAFSYINAKHGVIIEDKVQLGSHCSIYSVSTIDDKTGAVTLKKNSKIGSHSTILPGVTVGENNVLLQPTNYSLYTASDLNNSYESGKQYVQANLTEFGLVAKSDIEITATNLASLSTGWTLVSTPFTITDLSIFDSASVVWVYNNTTASWSAYSSNATMRQKIIDNTSVSLLTSIPAGSGVWVQK